MYLLEYISSGVVLVRFKFYIHLGNVFNINLSTHICILINYLIFIFPEFFDL